MAIVSAEQLNPYLVWLKGSREDGAVLAFAHTPWQARQLGFAVIRSWWDDATYFEMRARNLPGRPDLMRQTRDTGPHAVEDPETCRACEYWGGKPIEGGGCSLCRAAEPE